MIAQKKIPSSPAANQQSSIYNLPKFLADVQHITSVDTGNIQFVICCDRMKLYIFPLHTIGNKPLASIHQTLQIPNIKTLRTIAKNYLLIQTENKYMGIFQIIRSVAKEPGQQNQKDKAQKQKTQKQKNFTTTPPVQILTPKVQFSQVLKWKPFSSYFIREVMQNLFEVQVFFTQLQFEIFQFTNKNKRGSMSFTISPNGKITKSNKKQLYGSKNFLNLNRKLIYWLKNFSDKQFILQQIVQQPMGMNKAFSEPLGYFGVQRAQEYKSLYGNFVVRDCLNPSKKHRIQFDKASFLNQLKVQYSFLSPNKKKSPNQTSISIQTNPYAQLLQNPSQAAQNITTMLHNYKMSIFTDLLMIENKSKKEMQIYQIKTQGSQMITRQFSYILPPNGLQSKQNMDDENQSNNDFMKKEIFSEQSLMDLRRWEWYFGNSKKLIGFDRLALKLKSVDEMKSSGHNKLKVDVPELPNEILQKIQSTKDVTIEQKKIKETQNQKNITPKQQATPKQPRKTVSATKNIQGNQTNSTQQAQKLTQNQTPRRKYSKQQLQQFINNYSKTTQKQQNIAVNNKLIKQVEYVNSWPKIQTQPKIANNRSKFTFSNKNVLQAEKYKKQSNQKKLKQSEKVETKQKKLDNNKASQSLPVNQIKQVKQSKKPVTKTQQKVESSVQNEKTKVQQIKPIDNTNNKKNVNQPPKNQQNSPTKPTEVIIPDALKSIQGLKQKQKPPMKVIQRNKISVAKTFTQSGPNLVKQSQKQVKNTELKSDKAQNKNAQQKLAKTSHQDNKINNTQNNPAINQHIKNIDKKQIQLQKTAKIVSNPNPTAAYTNQPTQQPQQRKRFLANGKHRQKQQQKSQNKKQPQKSLGQLNAESTLQVAQNNQIKQQIKQQAIVDKKKFNVITRANLLKKKQEYPTKDADKGEIKQKTNDFTNLVSNELNKSPKQLKKVQRDQQSIPIQNRQTTVIQTAQNRNDTVQALSKTNQAQNKLQQTPKSLASSAQAEIITSPRTKYIPSIDINKASSYRNNFNNCDFLSQDSQSDKQQDNYMDEQIRKEKKVNLKSLGQNFDQQQQSIQQQIVDGSSSQQEKDLQHLIDDDITKPGQKSINNRDQHQQKVNLSSPSDHKQATLNTDIKRSPSKQQQQQQEIQKFCNILLDDDKGYQAIQKQKPNNLHQSTDNISNKNIVSLIQKPFQLIIDVANASQVKKQAKNQTKHTNFFNKQKKLTSLIQQQNNQINKLNSLLFKTSIKRDNIFSTAGNNDALANNVSNQTSKHKIQITQKTKNEILKDNSSTQNIDLIKKIQNNNAVNQESKTALLKKRDWYDANDSSSSQEQKNTEIVLNNQKGQQVKNLQNQQAAKVNNQINKPKSLLQQGAKTIPAVQKSLELQEQLQQKPVPQTKAYHNPFIQSIKNNSSNPSKLTSLANQISTASSVFPPPPPNWLSNKPPKNFSQDVNNRHPFTNFNSGNKSLNIFVPGGSIANNNPIMGMGLTNNTTVPSHNSKNQNLLPQSQSNNCSTTTNLFRKFLMERQNMKNVDLKNSININNQQQKSLVLVNENNIQIKQNIQTKKESLNNQLISASQINDNKSQNLQTQVNNKNADHKVKLQSQVLVKQAKPTSNQNIVSPLIKEKIISNQSLAKSQSIQQIYQAPVIVNTLSSTLLPQIQSLINNYQQFAIKQIQQQQQKIMKSIDQIPQTHNPYIKAHSLILPEDIKQQIIKQTKNSVKRWLSTKMLDKIEISFKEIMVEQKSVYEKALEFYENEARRKITTMQLQYEQQQTILMEIENISANMLGAVQSTIVQGQELHTYQLKQWKKEIQSKQQTVIDPLNKRVDDLGQYFVQKNQNISNLTIQLKQMKQILIQKLKKKRQDKQNRQKQRQLKKLKRQQKFRQDQIKKSNNLTNNTNKNKEMSFGKNNQTDKGVKSSKFKQGKNNNIQQQNFQRIGAYNQPPWMRQPQQQQSHYHPNSNQGGQYYYNGPHGFNNGPYINQGIPRPYRSYN